LKIHDRGSHDAAIITEVGALSRDFSFGREFAESGLRNRGAARAKSGGRGRDAKRRSGRALDKSETRENWRIGVNPARVEADRN
jgi:hypothetical protein